MILQSWKGSRNLDVFEISGRPLEDRKLHSEKLSFAWLRTDSGRSKIMFRAALGTDFFAPSLLSAVAGPLVFKVGLEVIEKCLYFNKNDLNSFCFFAA